VDVSLGHAIPTAGLRDGAVTRVQEQQRVFVIPQKNHSFYLLIIGLDVKRWKYGSTPNPDQKEMSTLLHTTTSASEPGRN
jgi:hypothetical protein